MAKLKWEGKWTGVPNSFINDRRFSMKVKLLWIYISSKPDGWDFSAERISAQMSDGINAVKSGLQDMEELGLLERRRWQNELGHWQHEYELKLPSVENHTAENNAIKEDYLSNTDIYTETEKPRVVTEREDGRERVPRDTQAERGFREAVNALAPVNKTYKVFLRSAEQRDAYNVLVEAIGHENTLKWIRKLPALHEKNPKLKVASLTGLAKNYEWLKQIARA
jgi:hypothetical protein